MVNSSNYAPTVVCTQCQQSISPSVSETSVLQWFQVNTSAGTMFVPMITILPDNPDSGLATEDDDSSFSSVIHSGVNASRTLHTDSSSVDLMITLGTGILLGLLILATAVGNIFVICVILLERHLQSVANYLILSLAVADLLVACLVMPLGAVYEVNREWTLGTELCDMWTSTDVLCCTASILHLLAIAADRYWAVTSIDYVQKRSRQRILLIIAGVWVVSLLISLGPMFGWKDSKWYERVLVFKMCMVSQDVAYQIFATMSTFYVPLAVILFLYWRIFQTAQKRIRRKIGNNAQSVMAIARPPATISEAAILSSNHDSPEKVSSGEITEDVQSYVMQLGRMGTKRGRLACPKSSKETEKERKAAKTLAIITGVFVVCWLPFFVVAFMMPICTTCVFHEFMLSFFLWLGYCNSTINPIVYTIFNPSFRVAFKKLLRLDRNTRRQQFLAERSMRASTFSVG